jgi:hypothetical protein
MHSYIRIALIKNALAAAMRIIAYFMLFCQKNPAKSEVALRGGGVLLGWQEASLWQVNRVLLGAGAQVLP